MADDLHDLKEPAAPTIAVGALTGEQVLAVSGDHTALRMAVFAGMAIILRRRSGIRGSLSEEFAAATVAVLVRPADHPDQLSGEVPLDGFWRKRGCASVVGFVAEFDWKDYRNEC